MPEQQVSADVQALARRLDDAWENREPISPLTETDGLTAEDAYAVQRSWTESRLGRGERILGRKIGLTSKGMQEQMGVDEPDYGSLWESRFYPAKGGRAEVPTETFIEPRLEGEVAFLIGRSLSGPTVTPQEVLAATEAVAIAVEVVDSRVKDWRIKLADTIADNASYGGFVLGPWSKSLREEDLRTLGMLIQQNGSTVVEGLGAAALGSPARSVAWLARKLHSFGVELKPGDFVLSGSLGKAVPASRGDVFVLEAHGQPPLTVTFA